MPRLYLPNWIMLFLLLGAAASLTAQDVRVTNAVTARQPIPNNNCTMPPSEDRFLTTDSAVWIVNTWTRWAGRQHDLLGVVRPDRRDLSHQQLHSADLWRQLVRQLLHQHLRLRAGGQPGQLASTNALEGHRDFQPVVHDLCSPILTAYADYRHDPSQSHLRRGIFI